MKNTTLLHNGLSWGALESLFVQSLITIHTVFLISYAGTELVGIVGVVCSVIYLLASLATAGFDITCGAFFSYAQYPFLSFSRFLYTQLLVTASILGIGLSIIWCYHNSFIYQHIGIVAVSLGIIGAEITKKIAKSIHALHGNFRIGAVAESMLTLSSIGAVWLLYFYCHIFTWHIILIPLLCSTVLSTGYLWFCFYQKLSDNPISMTIAPSAISTYDHNYVKIRMYAFVTQAAWHLFSGNVFIILTCSMVGFSTAAVMKVVLNTIHIVASIIEKMFGITSTTLFLYTSRTYNVLGLIMRYLIPLIAVVFLIGIYYMYMIGLAKELHDLFFLIISYACARGMQIVCNVYERFLLAYNKGAAVCALLIFSLGLSAGMWFMCDASFTVLVISALLGRVCYFITLITYTRIYDARSVINCI